MAEVEQQIEKGRVGVQEGGDVLGEDRVRRGGGTCQGRGRQ